MPVSESTEATLQGYSIVRLTETDGDGNLVIETYALTHESGGQLDEFADYADAVRALNRILMPLPGLRVPGLERAG